MNKFSLCLVLFNAAVLGWSGATEFSCTPNETYNQDCNTCVCSSDGKTAACQQMACLPEAIEDLSTTEEIATTEAALEHVESNNHVCTPDDIRMEDCNRCRCAANGIGWFCTKLPCPTKEIKKRAVKHPGRADCNPGEVWNDECNDCFCTGDGIPACTLASCEYRRGSLRQKRSLPECVPGARWTKECNSCFCTDTGIAACTLKGCLSSDAGFQMRKSDWRKVSMEEYSDPNFACEPQVSFKLDCNTCKCSEDGRTTAWCTKKRCVPEELVQPQTYPV